MIKIPVKQTMSISVLFIIMSIGMVASSILSFNVSVDAYPKQNEGGYDYHQKGMMFDRPGVFAMGNIASVQNENGSPAWILSGTWKGTLSMNEETKAAYQNATANNANTTDITSGGNNTDYATLEATFEMVRTNGSALHDHSIYNFTLGEISIPNNTTQIYNGTATITMRDGPVHGVPVTITSQESNIISIEADAAMINNHFGDNPIYGTISKLIEVRK
jgi:hypothetical protein